MYELLKSQFRGDKTSHPLRSIRSNGFVPGTIYGKDFSPVSFQVETMELKKFLVHSGQIFQVEIEGYGKHLVNLDNIQYDHMGNHMMHIAFHKISENQETTAELPIVLTGTAMGIKSGGVVQHVLQHVSVKGLPKDFPEHIEFDVTELDMNHHFSLSDMTPPKGLSWVTASTENVVSCHAPKLEMVSDTEESAVEVIGEETSAEATSEDEVKKAS